MFFPLVDFTLPLRAMGVGVASSMVPQLFLHRLVRARVSARTDLIRARALCFSGVTTFAVGCAIIVNGALDRSPEMMEHLPVVWVAHIADENTTEAAVGRNSVIYIKLDDPQNKLKVGHKVTVWSKPGRLGGRWFTRPAVADGDGAGLKP